MTRSPEPITDSMDHPIDVIYSPDVFLAQRIGGVSRYFTELIRYLGPFGINAHLPWSIHRSAILPKSRGAVRLPHHLQGHRSLKLAGEVNRITTRRALRRTRGLFHPTYYSASIPSPGIPRVVTIFDMTHERLPELFVGDPTSAMKARWCQSADLILTISEATKSDIVALYGIESARIVVTPLAASATTGSGSRRERERPYVLSVGQRWAHKEFRTTLSAFAQANLPSGTELVLFGDSGLSEQEHRLVNSFGLTGHVTTMSGGDDVLDSLYRNALALIYPSRYEGFGLPILEAMSRGCPVICSDLAVHQEVGGQAALFFEVGDAGEAGNLLSSVSFDARLRRDVISRGVSNAARFNWRETARITAQAYRLAMSTRSAV